MMNQKETHNKQFLTKQNSILFISGGLIIVVLILIAFLLMRPERSIANFCSERTKIVAKVDQSGKKNGNYPSTVLNRTTNDITLFIDGYKKLENVAPESISADVTTVRKGMEAIDSNPSNMLNAGIGTAGAELRLQEFTKKNCTDY